MDIELNSIIEWLLNPIHIEIYIESYPIHIQFILNYNPIHIELHLNSYN